MDTLLVSSGAENIPHLCQLSKSTVVNASPWMTGLCEQVQCSLTRVYFLKVVDRVTDVKKKKIREGRGRERRGGESGKLSEKESKEKGGEGST